MERTLIRDKLATWPVASERQAGLFGCREFMGFGNHPSVILAEWTAHPAKRRPQHVALFAMVAFVFCGAVLASLHSVLFTVLAAVVLTISVAPFLFPTHYELTEDGVSECRLGRTRSRPWSELRSAQIGPAAVLLSPFARRSYLERYRGLMLYLDGSDRAAVLEIVRGKLDATR